VCISDAETSGVRFSDAQTSDAESDSGLVCSDAQTCVVCMSDAETHGVRCEHGVGCEDD